MAAEGKRPPGRPKGYPKTGGRPKGSPNKMTRDVRAMILAALDKAGGVAYLTEQARKSPGPFLVLVGKVLPLQVTGANGADLLPQVVTHVHLPAVPVVSAAGSNPAAPLSLPAALVAAEETGDDGQ